MQLINTRYLTIPAVAHKPGPRDFPIWDKLKLQLLTNRRQFSDCPDLHIYTWLSSHNANFKDKLPIFQRSCENAGVSVTLLGQDQEWSRTFKVDMLLEALQTQREHSFLACDNWDCLLLADPNLIAQRLNEAGRLLFNGCPWDYPEASAKVLFAEDTWGEAARGSVWNRLNSGIIGGRKMEGINFLTQVLEVDPEEWIDDHEQLPCRIVNYVEGWNAVDHRCNVFQVVTGGEALSQLAMGYGVP